MKVVARKYPKGTISVVVITYNQEQFLTKSLESVFSQTRKADEVIVVNNGSTDNTAKILDKYKSKITTISHKKNIGALQGGNSGLLKAHGDYVIILASDDWFAPTILEEESKILDQNPEIAVVYSQSVSVEGNRRTAKVAKPAGGKSVIGRWEFERLLTQGDFISYGTALIRRSVLKKHGLLDPFIKYRNDYELWIRLARYYPFAYIAKPLAYYRIHNNYGIKSTGFLGSMEQELGYILKKHLPEEDKDLVKLRIQAYHAYYSLLFSENLLAGNFKKGWKFLLKSLQTKPLSFSHFTAWYPFAWYIKKKMLL